MTPTSPRRFSAALAVLLAVVALAVIAAGCGGSSSSDSGVANIEDGSSAAAAADDSGGTTEGEQEDFQQALLDYAQCMRDHGIDVPDPDFSGGGGGGLFFGPDSGIDPGDPDFQAAQEECGEIIQGSAPQISAEQQQELQDTLLEFAQCMRENGVDVPDPDFSEGGGGFLLGPGGNGEIDPDDPDFQAAQEECGEILQNAGFGGPGGGPPGNNGGGGS